MDEQSFVHRPIGDLLTARVGRDVRVVAGMMSGTSTDGLDIAILRVGGSGLDTRVEVVGHANTPYPEVLRDRLFRLYPPEPFPAQEIAALSWEMGAFYADALSNLLSEVGLATTDVDLVGCHGVLVYHGDGITFEIVESAVIAARIGCIVISDMRAMDCAVGGNGAPLSPYVDWLLFGDPNSTRAIQNLGGIANVAALPAGGGLQDVISYDCGPGNMVIDGLVTLLTHGASRFDQDGRMASAGVVEDALLRNLMTHPFLAEGLPRAAGREEFGMVFARALLDRAERMGLSAEDLVATATAFTARAIRDSYDRFILARMALDEVIVGGGGVHNPELMRTLRAELSPIVVKTHEDFGMSSDAREAITWAVLANECLHGLPTNLPTVTGARRQAILGKVTVGGGDPAW